MLRTCDVCVLLDGDEREKETIYCSLCDKHMCKGCSSNPIRRALAAFLIKYRAGRAALMKG